MNWRRWQGIGGSLLSGALLFLSTGANPMPQLTWVAPVPLLLVAGERRGRAAAAAALAAVAGVVGGVNIFRTYPDLPSALLLVVVFLTTIPLVMATLVFQRLHASPRGAFGFAASYAASEFLFSKISPHGTFGSIAYSQADQLALAQLASITGIWGITFLLALTPACLVVAWYHRSRRRTVLAIAAAGVVVPLVCVAFGLVRLRARPESTALSVGLAVSDSARIHFGATNPFEAAAVLGAYAARARQLGHDGARLVVLPEKFIGLAPQYEDTAKAILDAAVRETGTVVVAGYNLTGRSPQENVAVVHTGEHSARAHYAKAHLIGGLEAGYRPGHSPLVMPAAGVQLGVAICKDLDYPAYMRRYARAGAAIVAVPAWDFTRDGWLHSRMAIMRGIEGGYALARSAIQGRLTITDRYGRAVVDAASESTPDTGVLADVQVGGGPTLYARVGDLFAWACVAFAFVALFPARYPKASDE